MNTRTGLYGLNEPAPPPRPKSRVWKYIKIFLAVAAVLLVSLETLHRAGGNGENLKNIVEKYLSDSSGYKVRIGKFNAVSFYPLIGIDMNDVTFEAPQQVVVARIAHVNFSTSFWGASSGASIHTLDLRGASAEAGIASPGKIVIDRFFIDPKDKKTPQLSLTGSYGGRPVALNADLRIIPGLFGGVHFNFAEPSPFDLKAGDLHIAGQILTDLSGRSLRIDTLSVAQQSRPVKILLALNVVGRGTGVSGKVTGIDTDFDYTAKYSSEKGRRVIAASINGDRAGIDELVKRGGLLDDYKAFHDFWMAGSKSGQGGALTDTTLDMGIKIAHAMKSGSDLGPIDGRAVIRNGVFMIDPATGAAQTFSVSINAYFRK